MINGKIFSKSDQSTFIRCTVAAEWSVGSPLLAVCLCQLINTKTHDGKQTLMHFLADSIEKRFPDVMDFASEMLHVEKAARGQHFCCDNNHTTLMFAWSFLHALSRSVRRQKGRAFVPSKNVLLF